jgi:hypothetical protein
VETGGDKLFGRPKWRRENRKQVRLYQRLAKQISDEYEAKIRPREEGKEITSEEAESAFHEYNEHMSPVMSHLAHLRQEELLSTS